MSKVSIAGGRDAICGTPNAIKLKAPRTITTKPTTLTNMALMKRRMVIPDPIIIRPIIWSNTTSLMTPLHSASRPLNPYS
jgi:hypothetical protein